MVKQGDCGVLSGGLYGFHDLTRRKPKENIPQRPCICGVVVVGRDVWNLDKLMMCATAFAKLFNYSYRCIIAKKGKTRELIIGFDEYHFHHLAGLKYLQDIHELHRNRQRVFRDIIASRITLNRISESSNFSSCETRLNYLDKLENFMDSNFITFTWNKGKNSYSKIKGEYLLQNEIDDATIYLFIDKNSDTFFGRSFFAKGLKDYTINQSKWTLLYKEKINKRTNEVSVQYDIITPMKK